MKKTYALVAALFLVLLSSSFANASLDISVTVGHPQINQLEGQVITATTNERGKGILFVIQPAEGTPWIDFLNNHLLLKALWNSLSSDIRTQIKNKIGGKIVSFKLISTELGGGSQIVTFPGGFTGINGEPSTALVGKYKVIFVFLSYEASSDSIRRCCLFELDFDCASWFVVPEVPFGTIIPLLSSLIALPVFKLYRRRNT